MDHVKAVSCSPVGELFHSDGSAHICSYCTVFCLKCESLRFAFVNPKTNTVCFLRFNPVLPDLTGLQKTQAVGLLPAEAWVQSLASIIVFLYRYYTNAFYSECFGIPQVFLWCSSVTFFPLTLYTYLLTYLLHGAESFLRS